MIERVTIDGRPAAVAYLKEDFTPARSAAEAYWVKILYDDGEGTIARGRLTFGESAAEKGL